MSRLQQVRQLIADKRYDEARAILEKMDDPRARELLAKINRKAPRKRRGGAGRAIKAVFTYLLTIVLSALLTGGLLAGLVMVTAPMRGAARIQAAENIEATAVAEAATATPTPDFRTGVVTSGQNVNIRSGPATTNGPVAVVVPGTEIIILGENDDGTWFNVRLENGTEGWIAASLLDAEAAPTTVASDFTAIPDDEQPAATATPVAACDPEVARTWFNANRQAFLKVEFTLYQHNEAANVNYQTLADRVRESGSAIEQAEYPPCLEDIRQNYLAAWLALLNGYQRHVNGDPNSGNSEIARASSQLETANDQIASQFSVQLAQAECAEAEIWYAGTADEIARFLNIIDLITAETRPSNEIRSAIFDLQRIRSNVDVAHPECIAPAHNSLLPSVDAAVRLFQSIMSEDTGGIQSNLSQMVSQRTTFLNEMQRLGIRVVREPSS